MQLDEEKRGFSFNKGPLDMRMDRSQKQTAYDIVNTYSEAELGQVFRDYGEERNWRLIARAIVKARYRKPIQTNEELSALVIQAAKRKRSKIHPATLVFQALRIVVNHELESIEKGVKAATKLLSPSNRMGVLSFHRLEDRLVKNIFKIASKPIESIAKNHYLPLLKLLTKSPLVPSLQERFANRRSRSAKLRFAEKI